MRSVIKRNSTAKAIIILLINCRAQVRTREISDNDEKRLTTYRLSWSLSPLRRILKRSTILNLH